MIKRLLIVGAVAILSAAGVQNANAAPVVKAVALASAQYGWPHTPTDREVHAIPRHALNKFTPRDHGGYTLCSFGQRMGKVVCAGVTWFAGGQHDSTWCARFSFYEDGSYRLVILPPRAGVCVRLLDRMPD